MKTFGQILKEKLKEKELKPKEFAKKLGTRTHNIYTWQEDRGIPHPLVICDIADILECSLDELFGRVKK
jgi:transcriptional regulator with XRE-family HTH domain